jgi:hypothetical protein
MAPPPSYCRDRLVHEERLARAQHLQRLLQPAARSRTTTGFVTSRDQLDNYQGGG